MRPCRLPRRKVCTLTLTLALIPTLNLTLIRCAALRTETSSGWQKLLQQQQQAAKLIPKTLTPTLTLVPSPGPSPAPEPWP